jgi:hypothetical protein
MNDPQHLIRVDTGGGREEHRPVSVPANSHKAREEAKQAKPKTEPIVTGKVVQRKESPATRVLRNFIADDAGGIWQFVLNEVVIPAARNLIFDTGKAALERALFGDSRPSPASRFGQRFNYGGVSRTTTDPRPPLSRQARATNDYKDIVVSSRTDAENVLDSLRGLVVEYGVASVSDLYGFVGMTADFTDEKWGWEDLRSAGIRMVSGGHMLVLPRPVPIA